MNIGVVQQQKKKILPLRKIYINSSNTLNNNKLQFKYVRAEAKCNSLVLCFIKQQVMKITVLSFVFERPFFPFLP